MRLRQSAMPRHARRDTLDSITGHLLCSRPRGAPTPPRRFTFCPYSRSFAWEALIRRQGVESRVGPRKFLRSKTRRAAIQAEFLGALDGGTPLVRFRRQSPCVTKFGRMIYAFRGSEGSLCSWAGCRPSVRLCAHTTPRCPCPLAEGRGRRSLRRRLRAVSQSFATRSCTQREHSPVPARLRAQPATPEGRHRAAWEVGVRALPQEFDAMADLRYHYPVLGRRCAVICEWFR